MANKKSAKPNKLAPPIKNEVIEKKDNGLGGAVGFGTNGLPGLPGMNPYSEQVSQTDTIFKNLRWYLVSNFRQVLSEAYVEIGLVQTVVRVPVDDALRGGVEIKSQQLDEHQIKELQISMDRDDDIGTIANAGAWNRLFGGAGVIIMTDQDPETELDLDAITEQTPLEFRAVDMWELFWDKQNTEGYDPEIQTQDFEFYSYYGENVHKSRVMRLKGAVAPSFIRPRLRGWGFSVVEILVRSINQYLKATDLGFEVLDEFKLDVYKIKNLVNTLMSPNGDIEVKKRIQMANWQKNYQNAIVLDTEDDFDHKQLSFAGLAEAMAGIRMQVASDMRMPITKLFGTSASAGIGNTDQNDMENYNSMVEGDVRNKLKYPILRMLEIKCQKLFGFVPDDLEIAFKPLRLLSAVDEESVKTQKFTRLIQAKSAGEITTQEFRDAINKGNLMDVKLDTSEDSLNPNDPELEDVAAEGQQDPKDPVDVDDPGANREDTRKSRAWEYGGIAKGPKKPGADDRSVKTMNNEGEWDEDKHPRAEDGKFGKGGGSATPKKSKSKSKDAPVKKGAFKGFTDVKDPPREGSKTKDVARLCESTGSGYGKPSAVEYKSPASSTCNLVGQVALGKSSVKAQKEIIEHIQSAEVVLSEMGIKFKTPIDFVCQNVASAKDTQATFNAYYGREGNEKYPVTNPRIDLKTKTTIAKSLMHEIGHGIDYALGHKLGHSSALSAKKKDKEKLSPELLELHEDLAKTVEGSEFYAQATATHRMYLSKPTEVFARAFEVVSYQKAQELAAAGKIPESFVAEFRPDVFKTKDERVDEINALIVKRNEEISALGREYNAALLASDAPKIIETRDKYNAAVRAKKAEVTAATSVLKDGGWKPIPAEKQKEYTDKISDALYKIMKLDTMKNVLNQMGLKPFSMTQRLERILKNSAEFDRASYEADGGDKWIDPRRVYFFDNPNGVDEALWAKAKAASQAAFGEIKWQFVAWWYKKQGGKFQ